MQAQHTALHFTRGGHGQGVDKFDLFRVFVGREQAFHVRLQLGHQARLELLHAFGAQGLLRGHRIRRQDHIGLDQRTPVRVRLGNHGCIGHRRVLDQAVLDLARPNAVARGLEHIVAAALVPEVAVRIAHCQVSGAAPVAGELGTRGGLVLPIAQKENRVGLAMHVQAVQGHVAGLAHRTFLARVVNYRHPVAGVAHAHAAGFGRPEGAGVAHDVVDLGLAKHLVHGDAELLLAIAKHRVAHRLARAHDGFQAQTKLLTHSALCLAGKRLHHRLERRRKQKRVGDATVAHQRKGGLGAETPAKSHDLAAKVQRGQQRVHQPAGPGPVRRAPKHRVRACGQVGQTHARARRVKAKPVLAAHKASQVADERAVGNERALGVAGGAAGVNQHRRVCGQGVDGFETLRRVRQRFGEVQLHKAACGVACTSARAANHQHAAQQRALRRTVV